MSALGVLLRKELHATFTSPIAYTVAAVFLLVTGYTFSLTLFFTKVANLTYIFHQMYVLLILLMVLQVMSGLSGAVPASPGVLFAEAVRLVIFAGLLWGVGDLAVLWVKSHYDIRASRILLARMAHMMRETGEAAGTIKPASETSRADRGT